MKLIRTSLLFSLILSAAHLSTLHATATTTTTQENLKETTKKRVTFQDELLEVQNPLPRTVATQTGFLGNGESRRTKKKVVEGGVFATYCKLWDGCGYIIHKDQYTELDPTLTTDEEFKEAYAQAREEYDELEPHKKKHEYRTV